jgi:hypothetical protein
MNRHGLKTSLKGGPMKQNLIAEIMKVKKAYGKCRGKCCAIF